MSGAWFLVTPSLWIPVSSHPALVRSMEAPAVQRARKPGTLLHFHLVLEG